MNGFDAPSDQAMVSVCQEAQTSPFIIPGQVLFPDQDQDIDQGIAFAFGIDAKKFWEARAARTKNIYDTEMARGKAERAKILANESAKFPFYTPLNFVGCINYRSSDNKVLYQTSFMFNISQPHTGHSFPLLGGTPPVIRYPEPVPDDPDALVAFPRDLQRIVPGDQVKLGKPLYSTFAN